MIGYIGYLGAVSGVVECLSSTGDHAIANPERQGQESNQVGELTRAGGHKGLLLWTVINLLQVPLFSSESLRAQVEQCCNSEETEEALLGCCACAF